MLSVVALKVIVLFALLISTFLFSMLPLKVISVARRQVDRRKRRLFLGAISLTSCYAAGVFLATCLLDLFPGVQEKIEHFLSTTNVNTDFPLPEFLMAFGLFFILIVEQMVVSAKEHRTRRNMPTDPLLSNSLPANTGLVASETDEDVTGILGTPRGRSLQDHIGYQTYRQDSGFRDPTVQDDIMASGTSEYSEVSGHDFFSQSGRSFQSSVDTDHGLVSPDPKAHSLFRALMLLFALSIHSVIEGLAVGLQLTSKQVLEIFAALILHKSVIAFSLGVNLVQSQLTVWAIIRSNFMFAVASPIGIAIGILVTSLSKSAVTEGLVTGILEGLACGTFLYVVFFEVLPHEFHHRRRYPSRLLKVLMLVLGFSTVTGLLMI